MTARVGDPAPDFTLPGTDGTDEGRRSYALSDFRGKPLVVVFYPGDNTPVCTRQLNAYSTDIESFREAGAQVVAISPQSGESHEQFSCKQGGFAFPMLADEEKAVGAEYGILGPVGFYRRSAFVLDGEGVIRYAHRAMVGLTFRPTSELIDAVRAAS